MGIYCIAAGRRTDNRLKSLDRSHTVAELEPFLSAGTIQRLRPHFPDGGQVFLWGATVVGQLDRVRSGEPVLDFNNQRVETVFRFCFYLSTGRDSRLQDYVGWDKERHYEFVYFLKEPQRPRHRDKAFFLRALGASDKPHFFDSQRYLDDQYCSEAMARMGTSTLTALLGLPANSPPN
jgi:hypothetical protein